MEATLRELSMIHGPSGFEEDVTRYIANRLKGKVDTMEIDGIGNLIVRKKGHKEGPKIVITAHMDEVGFIVKKIEDSGLLRFEKLGGNDDRILLAQRVQINTRKGLRSGVIGTISAHMRRFDDQQKVRDYQKLYIDVGARSKQEAMELGIRVGDSMSWYPHFDHLSDNRLVGKAFDDRAGCTVLIHALEELHSDDFAGEIVVAFTVQEEVGLRGARVISHQYDADVALALDTTAVSDTPEEVMDQSLALGSGVGIKVLDFSLISNKKVREQLIHIAEEQQIPYQLEVLAGIGTDAGELSLAKQGIPTGVLSIPSRYAHSSIEVIDVNELKAASDLLVAFIKEMKYKDEYLVTL